MDQKIMACAVILGVLVAGLWVGKVQTSGDQYSLWRVLTGLDSAVATIRKGGSASGIVTTASSIYQQTFTPKLENTVNSGLDNSVRTKFSSMSGTPTEDGILSLRAEVVAAASSAGVAVSPVYGLAIFIILAVGALVALLTTLINRRVVNWEFVRDAKAKVGAFMKEYRAAAMKKDVKHLHKLDQRKAEINKLQSQMFSQTFKPTIIYTIPLLFIWFLLGTVYSGWTVALLPFGVDLPVFGPLVAFGFGWWYFITYLGLSSVFRKILIRE
ncbi:MAG: EMC3/TMCO1 family protein [Candidatus Hadarchaeota archaeon]